MVPKSFPTNFATNVKLEIVIAAALPPIKAPNGKISYFAVDSSQPSNNHVHPPLHNWINILFECGCKVRILIKHVTAIQILTLLTDSNQTRKKKCKFKPKSISQIFQKY